MKKVGGPCTAMCSSTQKKVKGVFVEQPNFCLKFWHFGKLKEASTDDVSTFVYVVNYMYAPESQIRDVRGKNVHCCLRSYLNYIKLKNY